MEDNNWNSQVSWRFVSWEMTRKVTNSLLMPGRLKPHEIPSLSFAIWNLHGLSTFTEKTTSIGWLPALLLTPHNHVAHNPLCDEWKLLLFYFAARLCSLESVQVVMHVERAALCSILKRSLQVQQPQDSPSKPRKIYLLSLRSRIERNSSPEASSENESGREKES